MTQEEMEKLNWHDWDCFKYEKYFKDPEYLRDQNIEVSNPHEIENFGIF